MQEMVIMGQIAIYSRKSRFTGKGESIENQIEMCRRYAAVHYPGEDVAVYEDEGFSGGNTERPNFKKMMKDAGEKKLSAVICYRLDRISRNIGDFAKLIEELYSFNVEFVSIKEQFDTSSPMGRAMMYISSVFSQLERETIAERIRDNMHELAKTGRWLGGTLPTGYASELVQNVTIDGKVRKTYKLCLVEDEARLIRQIFMKYMELNSLTKAESYFLRNGYKTKNGKNITRFALRNILSNPVYMIADEDAYQYLEERNVGLFVKKIDFDGQRGIIAYNRTIQKKGKTNKIRPIGEWIIAVGQHKGLIRGADWVSVQKALERNSSKAYRKTRRGTALLSGLLRCGFCGAYMRPKRSKRVNEEGEYIFSYICSAKEKSHGQLCNVKNANGNKMDAFVWNEIEKLIVLEENQTNICLDEQKEEIVYINANIAENERQIALLVNALAKSAAAEAYILTKIEEIHGNIEILKNSLVEINNRQSVQENFDKKDKERAMLHAIVEKVVWDGEFANIYLLDDATWGEDSK